MNDIEARLREALAARTDLVQETDLTSRRGGVVPLRPWWGQTGSWLAVAAVAIVVLAVPLLVVIVGSGDEPEPGPGPADSPSRTDRSTPEPAPRIHGIGGGDVDGDGARDSMSIESPTQRSRELWLRVELSSTGEVAQLRLDDDMTAQFVEVTDVDGIPGDEILLAVVARADRTGLVHPHTLQPRIVGLREGLLTEVLDVAPADRLAGDATYWWVRDGELWWWSSHEPVAEGTPSFTVDVTRFRAGDVLRPTYAGLCRVDRAQPQTPYECETY